MQNATQRTQRTHKIIEITKSTISPNQPYHQITKSPNHPYHHITKSTISPNHPYHQINEINEIKIINGSQVMGKVHTTNSIKRPSAIFL